MQKKKLILTYALLALTVVISVILGVVGHEKDSMTLFVKALSFSVSEGKTVTVACAGIYGRACRIDCWARQKEYEIYRKRFDHPWCCCCRPWHD